jgi:PTH1 family peptidyl-tRNA hydrolase
MKAIIALGNPGKKYEHTRHNAGFLALDFYLKNLETISCQSKFKAEICEMHKGNTKIFFIKPQTFMNASGETVKELVNFYNLNTEKDLLIIHDEMDLPFNTTRLSKNSSAAGHNGVKDIIEKLGTQNFSRIRIGVESRPEDSQIETENFVLQNFSAEELNTLTKEVFPKINLEIEKFIGN